MTISRSGMTEPGMTSQYTLSANDLCTIFEKLVAYNAISHSELCEISRILQGKHHSHEGGEKKQPQVVLNLPEPIYDMEASPTGRLRDISENGLRVAGIEGSVGQAKTFQIPIDRYAGRPALDCRRVQMG